MKSTCCIMLGQYRSASMHDANEGGDRITQIFLSLYRNGTSRTPHGDPHANPTPGARSGRRCTSLRLRAGPHKTGGHLEFLSRHSRSYCTRTEPTTAQPNTHLSNNRFSSTAFAPAVDTERTFVAVAWLSELRSRAGRGPVFRVFSRMSQSSRFN